MYEHRHQALISKAEYYLRIFRHIAVALGIVTFALGMGVLGYHILEKLPWIDALLNASMILGGMGPVDPVKTEAGKIFASFYALFSGLLFLVIAGIIFAPAIHRFLHRFHLEQDEEDQKKPPRRRTSNEGH